MLDRYKPTSYNNRVRFRDVAQVVERFVRDEQVASSSLVIRTYTKKGSELSGPFAFAYMNDYKRKNA